MAAAGRGGDTDQIAASVLALLPPLDGVDQASVKVDHIKQQIAALVAEAIAAAPTQPAGCADPAAAPGDASGGDNGGGEAGWAGGMYI